MMLRPQALQSHPSLSHMVRNALSPIVSKTEE